MNAREAMRRKAAKAAAEATPDTSHADAMTADETAAFDQAYTEAALGDAMAQAVYDRRTELGWTKAELARRTGMNERVIRRLEDGARPVTMPTLIRLGRALGGHFTVELRSDDPVVRFRPDPGPATRRTTRVSPSPAAGLPRRCRDGGMPTTTVHRLKARA